jgi:hypothetical protein
MTWPQLRSHWQTAAMLEKGGAGLVHYTAGFEGGQLGSKGMVYGWLFVNHWVGAVCSKGRWHAGCGHAAQGVDAPANAGAMVAVNLWCAGSVKAHCRTVPINAQLTMQPSTCMSA